MIRLLFLVLEIGSTDPSEMRVHLHDQTFRTMDQCEDFGWSRVRGGRMMLSDFRNPRVQRPHIVLSHYCQERISA